MDPFHAYDIRGIYPYEVNESFALELGRATANFFKAKTLVVGRDGRISSDSLFNSLVDGILDTGTNVIDVGRVSTPQLYYAIYSTTADGGIMITASHNPKEYNGFKICGPNASSVYCDNGLLTIKKLMEKQSTRKGRGVLIQKDIFLKYVNYLKKHKQELKKNYSLAADTANGMGIVEMKAFEAIYEGKIRMDIIYPRVDGNFPNHEANPVKLENTKDLRKLMINGNYDLGIALDGDSDRVVFITPQGRKVPSDMVMSLIAPYIGKPQDKFAVDVRASREVLKQVEKEGFRPYRFQSGRAYIIEGMKKEGCVFGAEKSGHYLYQSLYNTDSPILTIMHMLHYLEEHNLDEELQRILSTYKELEEINYKVQNPDTALEKIQKEFSDEAQIDLLDGVSAQTPDYRFNIRKSNTEPLVRLNIEGKNTPTCKKIIKRIEKLLH